MEYNETKIGNIETEKLKPAKVQIKETRIDNIKIIKNNSSSDKLICLVKHPESKELIEISSVKIEIDNKLKICGLWFNLDAEKNLKKQSALAKLMMFLKVETIKELENKEIETILDERGYLCFKGY
jgi:hypothetical protein